MHNIPQQLFVNIKLKAYGYLLLEITSNKSSVSLVDFTQPHCIYEVIKDDISAMTAMLSTQEKPNLETYSLLWLDVSINSLQENITSQQILQTLINQLKIFEDDNECERHIRSVSKEDRLILIVSNRFAPTIVPRIHQLRQVFSIYVYCMNKEMSEQWSSKFSKVRAVTMSANELVDKIRRDQNYRQQKKLDEAFSISIFSTSVGEGQSTTGINGHFIHSQLLIHLLVQMKTNSTDKIEFISLCRKQYGGIDNELRILDEFDQCYSPSSALWWYTRQSFLYRLLNKALRIQNIDFLFLFRFFIRDIEQQLENNKCTSSIRVYRGQLMSNEEIDVLKTSVGEFISINSFLSTSLDRELALFFITDSEASIDFKRVFFEIDANPQLENIKPFSDITSHSYFPDEKEVLFMIGSIFQITRITCSNTGVWIVQMKLCTTNNHQLKSLFEHLKSTHNDENNILLSFCDVLYKMGKYNDAEKYYFRLITELSSDSKYLARCYHALGNINMRKDELDSSLIWFNKSLEIKLRILAPNDPEVADDYNSMGSVYRKKNELTKAIKMFEKALTIWLQTFNENAPELAKYYSDIGNVYLRQKNFSKALEYHQKALNINENHLPKYHSYLGSLHVYIATVYRCLEEYDLSLKYAHLAFEIFQKSLPSQHSRIGWVYENIGLVYEKQDKLQQSLSYLEKAINNYRQTLPDIHYYITDVKQNIQRVSSKLEQQNC